MFLKVVAGSAEQEARDLVLDQNLFWSTPISNPNIEASVRFKLARTLMQLMPDNPRLRTADEKFILSKTSRNLDCFEVVRRMKLGRDDDCGRTVASLNLRPPRDR